MRYRKKRNKFEWIEECQRSVDMLMVSDKSSLESNASKTVAVGALFKFQQDKWVSTGYLSNRLLQALQNHSIIELDLTGLACIHSFSHLLKHQCF